jgi:hypothetical protein
MSQMDKGRMLPGIAGIAMFMMFLTLLNVYGALTNVFGTGRGKYGVLMLCSMLIVGVFGLLRMKRWGWAIVLAGTLLSAVGDVVSFRMGHQAPFIVIGLFKMVFFLYLVRPEIRDRMV